MATKKTTTDPVTDARIAAEAATPEAIKVLRSLARSAKVPPGVRRSAAVHLLQLGGLVPPKRSDPAPALPQEARLVDELGDLDADGLRRVRELVAELTELRGK